DLVCFRGLGSSIDLFWDYAPAVRALERMASFSRLILFDRRGTGSSDPVPLEALGSWEHYTEDLQAVLDAVGSEEAVLYGTFEAGSVAILYAAAQPHRTRGLILVE